MRPTVARIVHYHLGERPLAALITKVHDASKVVVSPDGTARDVVNLVIFTEAGTSRAELEVPFSESPKAGHWTWPPRV